MLGGPGAGLAGQPGTADRTQFAFDPPVPKEYTFDADRDEYRDGVAVVDDERYETLRAALAAARPGDTVRLSGWFEATPVVNTTGITLVSAPDHRAVINGSASGHVLTIAAPNVTVRRVWVRNSGFNPSQNDAAIWVDGADARIVNVRLTEFTFGIWLNGVTDAYIANNTIVGRERIHPLTMRGNGIQVWKTTDSVISHNRITDVRDGIYYSFSSHVTEKYNIIWDLRYGTHYMYSDHCTLAHNVAFNNDAGWALMVSTHLTVRNNVAFNNTGQSGHGILVKAIDDSRIRHNTVVANENGFYIYNSINDTFTRNVVLGNTVGVNFQAGNRGGLVYNNTFVRNDRTVHAVLGRLMAWNTSDWGNYWASARIVDVDGDGRSELRYQPAGVMQELVRSHPQAVIFTQSPTADMIRRAQKAFPIIDTDGVVDYHPLAAPVAPWRSWYHGGHDWSWWYEWSPRTEARV
ncbi:MAG: nitrous oxide reductase family maturation protein NosD [Halorientalis sp.]